MDQISNDVNELNNVVSCIFQSTAPLREKYIKFARQ